MCYLQFFSLSNQSTIVFFFFFNDTPPTEIYPLSLHDAFPILSRRVCTEPSTKLAATSSAMLGVAVRTISANTSATAAATRSSTHIIRRRLGHRSVSTPAIGPDRKSTRLNSSHLVISYAVFCLK